MPHAALASDISTRRLHQGRQGAIVQANQASPLKAHPRRNGLWVADLTTAKGSVDLQPRFPGRLRPCVLPPAAFLQRDIVPGALRVGPGLALGLSVCSR